MYLPNAENTSLVPEFYFGAYESSRPSPIQLNSSLARFNPAASAFSLKSLVQRKKRDANGNEIDVIAAAVSHVDPIVVLYLETHDDFQQHYSSDPVPIFRALLQFFSDCLDRVNSSDVR